MANVNISEILKRIEEIKKEKCENDRMIKEADKRMMNTLREACVELGGKRYDKG